MSQPNTVLTYTIRADSAQRTAEVKRAERKFTNFAKGLGLDLSSAAERTVEKVQEKQRRLKSK